MLGITELAGEYHRSVELLEDRLTQLKEEIKTARGPHYFDLKRRIELLRFELVDTRETERILHDYYHEGTIPSLRARGTPDDPCHHGILCPGGDGGGQPRA